MNSLKYRVDLDKTQRELEETLREREALDAKIVLLKRLVDSYSKLLGMGESAEAQVADAINAVPAEPGITNAIRQVLMQSKIPLSASEIKTEVVRLGVNLSEYVNASAVIHNTLTRLEKQHEVIRVQNPTGQTVAYILVKNSLYRRLYELA